MNKEKRESAVREAKQNLILDAARKVFTDKGFHDVRLEDIAEAAGFSKASLYNYYENKELIFINLADREYHLLVDKIREKIDLHDTFENNMRVTLQTMFSVIGEHFPIILAINQLQCQMIFDMESLHDRHPQLLTNFHSRMTHMSMLFASLIERGRVTGEITSKLPDESIGKFLGSLIRGTMMIWKMEGKMDDIGETVDRIMTFTLNGVKQP